MRYRYALRLNDVLSAMENDWSEHPPQRIRQILTELGDDIWESGEETIGTDIEDGGSVYLTGDQLEIQEDGRWLETWKWSGLEWELMDEALPRAAAVLPPQFDDPDNLLSPEDMTSEELERAERSVEMEFGYAVMTLGLNTQQAMEYTLREMAKEGIDAWDLIPGVSGDGW